MTVAEETPAAEEPVKAMPRYPVYILSKDRFQYERAFTARAFATDGVPFILAVESHQVEEYRELCRTLGVPEDYVHDIGFSNLGMGCASVRNWITDHARDNGHARQWQFDDNVRLFYRLYHGIRLPCRAGLAMRVCEDFTDRYTNVGLSGFNYAMFVNHKTAAPLAVNVHVYSATLVNTAIKRRWRGPYNEDTDMCLQVLADGWCTILLNVFTADKKAAFKNGGKRNILGGMSDLYAADGRLRMARSLERRWPGVVTVERRFQRPQHVVKFNWRHFDTQLQLREDLDVDALLPIDEYGMSLERVGDVQSARIDALVDRYGEQ